MNLAMKYLLENKETPGFFARKLFAQLFSLTLVLGFMFTAKVWSQTSEKDCFPPQSNRLVNDYVNALKPSELTQLENKLVQFSNQSSTQIAVVFLEDICGYDRAQYTYTLAEKWGIGQEGKNNGILIMVVPFGDAGQRTTFIAVGYGLEGAVPDAIAKRIIENEMIPNFKMNDFYAGIDAASNVLISLTSGEFTADDYAGEDTAGAIFGAILVLLVLALVLFSRLASVNKYASRNHMGFWAAMALMNAAASSRKGSYNHFSSGGGGFGGGGFGGFGGGSFGGGGAGGSW